MERRFQQIFKELRQEKGLTQAQLAEILNYTQGNISGWESGAVEPKASALMIIANYFDVTTDYLIGRTDDFGTRVATLMGEGSGFSSEERRLVENYRELNNDGKRLINETIKTLLATTSGAKSEQRKNNA